MNVNNNFRQWLELSRLQTALVTTLALWIGYTTVAQLTVGTFLGLGFVGISVHLWGFILNEVNDKDYDKKYGDVNEHALNTSSISEAQASLVAWAFGALAILFSAVAYKSFLGLALIVTSFAAGSLYNRYSKKHWWSNVYLSAWVLLLTLSGAAFAGEFSIYTWSMAGALAIQIFLQVVEGDIKDITGPEQSLAEKLGVKCDGTYIEYPHGFRQFITTLKLTELGLVSYIVYTGVDQSRIIDIVVLGIFITIASLFIATSTLYLTARFDRDTIKKRSSMHELSSVLMLGVTSYWLDHNSAIFIALAPVVWYLLINKLLHSGTLNPDV